MLVLSRRLHETIVLPDCDVTLTVLSIHQGQVRLGVSAPRSVTVHRKEVWDRIQSELTLEATPELIPRAPRVPK